MTLDSRSSRVWRASSVASLSSPCDPNISQSVTCRPCKFSLAKPQRVVSGSRFKQCNRLAIDAVSSWPKAPNTAVPATWPFQEQLFGLTFWHGGLGLPLRFDLGVGKEETVHRIRARFLATSGSLCGLRTEILCVFGGVSESRIASKRELDTKPPNFRRPSIRVP